MGTYVDTDLQSLVELKHSLVSFQEKTEMMRGTDKSRPG